MVSGLEFRTKSRLRRIVYSKGMVLALLVLLFLFAEGAWGMYKKQAEATAKENISVDTLSALKAREEGLVKDINRLKSERGVEEEIRSRFMVAKEGENVMIVSKPEKPNGGASIVVPAVPDWKQRLMGAVGVGE